MFWNVGTSEGVDTLCIIAHHANILMHSSQLLKDHVLGKVCILELIYQYIFKLMLVLVQFIGMVAQQYIHVEKQVVEIHA